MKVKGKSDRTRDSKAALRDSGIFVVPSHGRLARRGSTAVVDEGHEPAPRSARERAAQSS